MSASEICKTIKKILQHFEKACINTKEFFFAVKTMLHLGLSQRTEIERLNKVQADKKSVFDLDLRLKSWGRGANIPPPIYIRVKRLLFLLKIMLHFICLRNSKIISESI